MTEIGRLYSTHHAYYKMITAQELPPNMLPENFITQKEFIKDIFLPSEFPKEINNIDDLEVKLALLMHYSLGIIRYDPDSLKPCHRPVPSPGSTYPTEIYISTFSDYIFDGAGVYRYHPVKHSLEKRRSSVELTVFEKALGCSLEGAIFGIILSSDLWRVAFKYGNYALNLAALEAGHVMGQLILLSEKLGLSIKKFESFLDKQIIKILGLDEEAEVPLMAIIFWAKDKYKQSGFLVTEKNYNLNLSDKVYKNPNREYMHCFFELHEMIQASRLNNIEELYIFRDNIINIEEKSISHHEPNNLIEYDKKEYTEKNFVETIKNRRSSVNINGFITYKSEIQFESLVYLLNALFRKRELVWEEAWHGVSLYLVANLVDGLESGVYEVSKKSRVLRVVSYGSMHEKLQKICLYPSNILKVNNIPASFFFVVDYNKVFESYGNRGYQIIHTRIGQISQYLTMLAAEMKWFMRPLKCYYEMRSEKLLGLLGSSSTVVYQLVFGEYKSPTLSFDMDF